MTDGGREDELAIGLHVHGFRIYLQTGGRRYAAEGIRAGDRRFVETVFTEVCEDFCKEG